MLPSPSPHRLLVAVAVAVLVLGACGDDDTSNVTTPTTAGTSTMADTATTSTTSSHPAGSDTSTAGEPEPPAPGPVDADEVIEVSVSRGAVEGGGRHRVSLGDKVVLAVTSDVDDEIHLHGYDLYADVLAGEPSLLVFDATIPGVFEAELHDAALPLVELEIS